MQACTEEGVEHYSGSVKTWLSVDSDTQGSQRRQLLRWQHTEPFGLGQRNAGKPSPAVEMASSSEAVTTVVSCPADHIGTTPAMPGQLPARGLHQPRPGQPEAFMCQAIDLRDLSAAESGKNSRWLRGSCLQRSDD